MTWQGVPWAVSGATHPHEVARLLAYMASGGGEGVVTPQGCAVRPLDVPGAGVQIKPGAVSVLNRGTDVTGLAVSQSYLVRNPAVETVALAPGGGADRYDLVCVLVEDPQYDGQPVPASVPNGPYVRTVVYSNVLSTTATLEAVDPGQTGYALARVKVAAGSSVVNLADVTDLRQLVAPRIRVVPRLLNLPSDAGTETLTSAGYSTFPNLASWNDVEVPSWATKVQLELHAAAVQITDDATDGGSWAGKARLALGTINTAATELKPPDPTGTKKSTFAYLAAGELKVPKAMRGTVQTLKAQALVDAITGGLTVKAGWGTTIIAKATFLEAPDAEYWEA